QRGDHGVDPVQSVRAVGAFVVAEASVRGWVVADPGGGEWGERSARRGPVADGLHDADADRRGCAEVAGDGVPQGARAEVEPVTAIAGGCVVAAVPASAEYGGHAQPGSDGGPVCADLPFDRSGVFAAV